MHYWTLSDNIKFELEMIFFCLLASTCVNEIGLTKSTTMCQKITLNCALSFVMCQKGPSQAVKAMPIEGVSVGATTKRGSVSPPSTATHMTISPINAYNYQ